MSIEKVSFENVEITGGFWKTRQNLVRKTTVQAVYDRFSDTGRFDAFRFDWKEGMPNRPHIFWDSDVAKWIEGVAYLCQKKREPRFERIVDRVADLIEKNQMEDGYFNIYYILFAKDSRFTVRDNHELYCAGHLMEAAVAYYRATGKRKLLYAMTRYADYIEKRFKTDRDTGFTTPGHEEIELALVKLYKETGEKRYLELSKFFVDERGKRAENKPDWMNASYNQSHVPVREQLTAEGHSVRACYLYCAMADLAYLTDDEELKNACKAIFDDITLKKMYITGGIGSSSHGEAFTVPYDLPNIVAYTETCAAIGLALFARRMSLIEADSKYADTVERIIYNGFLSSVSLDGKSFFYQNPTEIVKYFDNRDTSVAGRAINTPPMQRSEVFGCSCCPPNIVRFIPSLGDFMYTTGTSEDGRQVVFVHQFMDSRAEIDCGGRKLRVVQKTRYPENGKVKITVEGADVTLAVRVPWWSDAKYETEKGYAYFDVADGGSVELDFGMKIKVVEARREVVFDAGRCAVMRGPVVYCLEGCDNPAPLRGIVLKGGRNFRYSANGPIKGVPCIKAAALVKPEEPGNAPLYSERTGKYEETTATLIPYYAFANRGPSDMQIFTFVK
ncbi:MAG: glycoside hydrolase family 127 protein [Clostridia bacterium]|nr:glycoside hydrolase family 127 protein [Clostridia bacterium]